MSSSSVEDHDPQDESQVVGPSGVVGFIDPYLVGKEADDEGEKGDETVPETGPETGGIGIEPDVAGGTGGED